MSIFNPFAKPDATPTPTPTPTNITQPPAYTANPANQPDPHAASDPAHPTHGTNPGAADNLPTPNAPQQTPLDLFEQMFHNKPTEGDEPVDVTLAIPEDTMNKVMEQVDFSKVISPELMTKFQSGDVGAVMEVMKVMSAEAYRQSLTSGTAVTNSNLNLREGQLQKLIDNAVQQRLSADAVQNSDIPNIEHPAVKREVQRVAAQFRAANPDATAAQIAQGTKNYFNELRAAMTPTDPAIAEQAKKDLGWTDVDDWLGGES